MTNILLRAFAAAMLTLLLSTAFAQSFPTRPVRFIVPFVPGGGTDTFARILGSRLSETWGQQMIIDNRPGAQGNIGTILGAKAAPDGYTLTLAFVGTLSINPHIYQPPGFDALKDFAAITRGTVEPWVLTVNGSSPAKDVKELIKSLALELGPYNVRANLIAVGFIDTRRVNPEWYASEENNIPYNAADVETTPLRRPGTPQEVANVALFLASEESSFVTGDRIVCAGGKYM